MKYQTISLPEVDLDFELKVEGVALLSFLPSAIFFFFHKIMGAQAPALDPPPLSLQYFQFSM